MKIKRTNLALGLFILALLFAFMTLPIVAQEAVIQATTTQGNQEPQPLQPKNAPQWGGAYTIATEISPLTCVPIYSTTAFSWAYQQGISRYCTGGTCAFNCPINVPTGAVITDIAMYGCDSSATGSIEVALFRNWWAGPYFTLATIDSGDAATPGCSAFYYTLPTSYTVDDWNNSYWFQVALNNNDLTTTFSGLRVRYHLQVSPAPGAATFTDVPTSHIFFQYIEALASSGITGGCATGYYCPDNYVTRGQMAKFLSIALGLQWIN